MAKWGDFETHSVGTGKRIEGLEADLTYWQQDSAAAWDKCEEHRVKLTKAVECIPALIVIALDNLDTMNAETRHECEQDIAKARAILAELKGQNDE